jgi:hypothetical protein
MAQSKNNINFKTNKMKKILIVFGIALLSFACKAQSNSVIYHNVYVNNISIATFSPNDFINTIGKPTSKYIDDWIGFYTDVYKKDENRFDFYKKFHDEKQDHYKAGDLLSFDIFTSDIIVKVNKTIIKVGDRIDALKSAFPKSYKNNTKYKKMMIFFIGDMNGGNWESEDRLNIEYNENTQKITAIILYYGL